jgi:putative tricarboxylic transport membrane protein
MSEPRPSPDYAAIAASAAFVVAGALALWYSREFSVLGSVFPRTIGTTMIVLSIAHIFVALVRRAAPQPRAAGSAWRRIALIAVFVAWSTLLEHVGFLATSIVAYTAILLVSNYDRWTARMAIAYGLTGALVLGGLYAIFRFLLQVPLPAGMLF